MNKKLKSEKGAITLVVLVTMLFLIAFLMTLFLRVANKAQTSAETTEQIKQKYNNLEDEEIIYQSYFADEEVIPIYTVEQLKKLGSGEQVEIEQEKKIYTFANDGYYVLKNNIDINKGKYTIDEDSNITFNEDAEQWAPFDETFTGTLDGLGHEISGIYIKDVTEETGKYKGLFSKTNEKANIKNIGITDSYIENYEYTGTIVGQNTGVVKNCHTRNSVIITGSYGGGIVGHNGEAITDESGTIIEMKGGTIENCYNESRIECNNLIAEATLIGGICGNNFKGTISKCYNKADLNMSILALGGIAGQNTAGGTIKQCYNLGKIQRSTENTSRTYIGGIAGSNTANVYLCYNLGDISNVGEVYGGVVGFNARGIIEYCFNNSNVTGKGNKAGGVVGDNYSGQVKYSYNLGNIDIEGNYAGGISGYSRATGANINHCYNIGNVTAGSSIGRISGFNNNKASIIKCFYLGEGEVAGTNQGTITDCANKSETEMKAVDGSFIELLNEGLEETVWAEDKDGTINNGYPYLIQLKSFMQK